MVSFILDSLADAITRINIRVVRDFLFWQLAESTVVSGAFRRKHYLPFAKAGANRDKFSILKV